MDKTGRIPVFELNKGAKAGFFMRLLSESLDEADHDVTSAHRDDSYLLFVLKAGTCRVVIDFEESVFSGPACCLIHPDQVHGLLEAQAPDGWMIAFEPGLLTPESMPLIAQVSLLSVPDHQTGSLGLIYTLTELLWQTFRVDETLGDPALTLRYLLNALITMLAGLAQANGPIYYLPGSRADEIAADFRQLLNANGNIWKRPAQYAQQLHLSVNHLNDTVKAKTGYSVSYWIQYQTMLEARRQLYHTQQTVKQIAHQLGFDDQHYFSRIFRKVTGQAPVAFRRLFRDLSTKSPF